MRMRSLLVVGWLATVSGAEALTAPSPTPQTHSDFLQELDHRVMKELRSRLQARPSKKQFRLLRTEGEGTSESIGPALRQAYAQTPSIAVRCKILEAFPLHRLTSEHSWVERQLKDRDVRIRTFAVWVLGELQHPSSRNAVWERLEDPHPEVRLLAMDALSKFHHPEDAPFILPFLDDDDVQVRYIAAVAIGRLTTEAIFPDLSQALHREPSPEVREALVRSWIGDGSASGTRALIEHLQRYPSAGIEELMLTRFMELGDAGEKCLRQSESSSPVWKSLNHRLTYRRKESRSR